MKKGSHISEEIKQRISVANKGRKHSEESKQKMSAARKGKKLSEETKQKISAAGKGKKMTDETRQKISAANKGKKRSDETRQKMRGRVVSDEHKQKISVAHKGKPLSEEHKQKISAANKGKKLSEENKDILKRMSRYGYYIQIDGHPFKSIKEAAGYYNIDYKKLLRALPKKNKDKAIDVEYDDEIREESNKRLAKLGLECLEYDYQTATVFKRRWGKYLEKELEERPYRKDEIIFMVLHYKAKN